jgi:hypothetical protein
MSGPVPGLGSPPLLADLLAALMIVVATVAAARLVWWRLCGGRAEPDADALHVLMGAAMAGIFEPRISPVPGVAWLAVFTAAAGWFTWRAIRKGQAGRGVLASHPAPHAVECAAMIYMLWPVHQPAGHDTTAMAGMGEHARMLTGNPVVAVVLAAFMLGYIAWTVDQFARGSRAATRSGQPPRSTGTPASGSTSLKVLAPRLGACQKIAMSLAMGYMLVTMF